MKWYAELFRKRRGLVAAFVLILSSLAFFGLTRLRFDDVPRGIFEGDGEEYARLESVYRDFGADDNDVIVLLEREPGHAAGWFDEQGVEVLRNLEKSMREVPGVEMVIGLGSTLAFDPARSLFDPSLRPLLPRRGATAQEYFRAREESVVHPIVGGRLISSDGHAALIVVRLDRSMIEIHEMEESVSKLRALAAQASTAEGIEVRVTGVPPVRVDIYTLLPREQVFFMIAGAVICTLLALWIFRDLRAVVATVIGPIIGAVWTLGFCGLMGQKLDLLSAVLPELALVIGFTDSVHMMIDARAARARGVAAFQAAVDAIRHVGMPCLLTSVTTAVGFGSLLFADVPVIRRFGLLAAVAVSLTFLSVVTVLPLMVSSMARLRGARPRALIGGGWGGFVERTARFVVQRPVRITIVGIVTSVACLGLASRLVPENRLTEALPRKGDAYNALIRAEKVFGGVLPAYILVEWDPQLDLSSPRSTPFRAMDEVRAELMRSESVHAPLVPRDFASLVPGGETNPAAALGLIPKTATERFWRPDLGRAVITFQVPDGGRELTEGVFRPLVQELDEISQRYDDVELHLTGTDFVARNQVNRMIVDLATSLALAALVIFGVLALEFRSLSLGLISLLPNLFPLTIVAALLVLAGQPLQMSSAVLFTILLGLAVDDTIHILARYRREGGREGGNEAIVRASAAVGEAIGFTTLVLVAGFGVVVFSAVPTNQVFAVMTCIGLVAALVGDLVLLPALLALRS